MNILVDAKMLLSTVLTEVIGSTGFVYRNTHIEAMPVWECLSIRELFLQSAGWDPLTDFDHDRFDMDFAMKVEPCLPRDRPVIIKDYPVEAAALARCRPGNPPVAERWELFLGGRQGSLRS
jgi:lysyl-tRNA synthetase class 2